MTPTEYQDAIEKLTITVKGIRDKLKEKMDEMGPDVIPPITVIVQKSMEDLGDGNMEAVYLGASIDPERQEDAIRELLERFPDLNAYGLIIHANSWIVDLREHPEAADGAPDVAKHLGEHKDTLLTSIVEREKVTMLSVESYTAVGKTLKWTDENETLEIFQKGTFEANPAYHRPLITEEDFE